MASVGGGYLVSDALAFGMPSMETQMYFANQMERLGSGNSANFGFTTGFLQQAKQLADSIGVTTLIDRAARVINKIDSFIRPNVISELYTVEDFQAANSINQRYIMACPEVRSRWQDNRLDGYSDSYVDSWPATIGETHNDYRKVMTGIIQYKDDGSSYYKHYYQELDNPEEVELSSTEKFTVLNNWNNIVNILALEDDDPTNEYGGKL